MRFFNFVPSKNETLCHAVRPTQCFLEFLPYWSCLFLRVHLCFCRLNIAKAFESFLKHAGLMRISSKCLQEILFAMLLLLQAKSICDYILFWFREVDECTLFGMRRQKQSGFSRLARHAFVSCCHRSGAVCRRIDAHLKQR